METDTEAEGEYVAALTERDRKIYNRGYSAGILARSSIDFGPVPNCDHRTYRDGVAGTDTRNPPDCVSYRDTDDRVANARAKPYSYVCTHVDAYTDADWYHYNIHCTHVDACTEPRTQAQAHLDNDCPYTHDDTDCHACTLAEARAARESNAASRRQPALK